MATLALSVAGSAVGFAVGGPFGPAVGRGLGALAGAYIDSQLFAPKKKAPPQGPRIEDLSVTVASYGQPIALAFGQKVRAGGVIIWNTDLVETPTTVRVKSGGKGGSRRQTTTTFSYSISVAVMLCEGEIDGVDQIYGDGKLIWDAAVGPAVGVDAIRVYPGTATQLADSFIASIEGAANAPAYRRVAYVVLQGLQLANHGNRLPRLEFVFRPGQESVAGAIAALAARAGLDTCDVASVTAPLPGYVVARQTSARAAIEELMQAYGLVGAAVPGGVTIKPRGVCGGGGMDAENLGTGSERPTEGDAWRMARAQPSDIPREITLQFIDSARDYQPSAVRSQRQDGLGESSAAFSLAVVLDPDTAQARVEQMHADQIATRNTVDGLFLPPSFSQIRPGDSVDVALDGIPRRITLTKATTGANMLVEVAGTEELAGTWLPYAAIAEKPTVPVQTPPAIVNTVLHLMDIPLLTAADDDPGFYYAVSGGNGWRSAAVLRSADGVDYSEIGYQNLAALAGTCQTTLPAGSWLTLDEASTLDVLMLQDDDELESVTDADLFNGANGALVGDEIVQFATATLIAPRTYRLSRFLRGRLGTDHHIATHAAAERFVLLSGLAGVERIADGIALRNATRQYKAVSLYQDAASVTAQPFANTCVGLRPYSPVNVLGARDGGGNLTVAWTRRSRIPTPMFFATPPLGEASELYEVEIMNGGTVVRTITGLTSPAATYTAAQQTADFGTLQPSVSVRVYQISATVGRSVARAATV